MNNEIEIIKKAKKGDELAFEQLANSYKKVVNSICKKYFLAGGDNNDLVQEAMIALYKAILTFEEDKQVSFYSYCKACIENRLKNEVKKDRAKKNAPLNDADKYDEQGDVVYYNNLTEKTSKVSPVEVVSSPEETIESNESLKQLRLEIESNLSNLEVKVLELFISGKTYDQIAEELNIKVKSVDNALNRIRNKNKHLKSKI